MVMARHGAWHSIWYGLVGKESCMVWPGGRGMIYGMAWRAWHGIWYGLAGKEWSMVWPGGHGMIYGMAGRSWHGICYGLVGITWYKVWPGGHRMTYGMALRGMSWYVERHSITCFKVLPWAIVLFKHTGPVHK